jgi:hypothetical protein
MKKLMMMLVFALVAGMSQAAVISWSTGRIYTPGVGGVFGAAVGSTTGTYLAMVYFYTDSGGVNGITLTGGNTDNSTTAIGGSVLNSTTVGYNFLASTTYYGKVVVTTTDGNWMMTSGLASSTVPGTGDGVLNFTTAGAMPSQWTAVPEPTSMALLALGAAALGLRRKLRK